MKNKKARRVIDEYIDYKDGKKFNKIYFWSR